MRITKVTMTGADDSIRPELLPPISREFPFVEWGILFSKSNTGTPRYPSLEWVEKLASIRRTNKMNLCAHLCGKYVREVLEEGDFLWSKTKETHPEIFDRIQLNFHAEKHILHPKFIEVLATQSYEFIFQMDGTSYNEALYYECRKANVNVFPLFDVSGGAGVLPAQWIAPFKGVLCGYAGGLGPDTLMEQLLKISEVVGDREIWIDMETRIRSNDDEVFDLTKVHQCLSIAKKYTE